MAKEYRLLTGLNYPNPDWNPADPKSPREKRVERGDMASDLPAHGTGRCDSSCRMPGAHDWFLTGGVVEDLDATPADTPREG